MKRLEFNNALNYDEQEQKRFANVLAENVHVRNLLYENKIPVEQLEKHPQRFKRWLDNRLICEGCTNLKQCKQKKKGYRLGLIYDDILLDQLEACDFEKEKIQEEKHLSNFIVSDMPESLITVSFDKINFQEENRTYINVLMETMKCCEDENGLYLYGNMGTGKTYLAACATNRFAKMGKKVSFVHMPTFTERVKSMYKTGEYTVEVDRLKYSDFVVFDDIGAEEVTDRIRSIILSILDARMQNNRCTWFTSNYDYETLLQHFKLNYDGDNALDAMRIMERIKKLSKPLEVIGDNRRDNR